MPSFTGRSCRITSGTSGDWALAIAGTAMAIAVAPNSLRFILASYNVSTNVSTVAGLSKYR
jgi:hypothetical protein